MEIPMWAVQRRLEVGHYLFRDGTETLSSHLSGGSWSTDDGDHDDDRNVEELLPKTGALNR